MRSVVFEMLSLLVLFAMFLTGMFWLYRTFNQKMLREALDLSARKRAAGYPDIDIPV